VKKWTKKIVHHLKRLRLYEKNNFNGFLDASNGQFIL